MDHTVIFEDPPAPRPAASRLGKGRHGDIAAQLRARPEEWAVVATCRTIQSAWSMAGQIRRGCRGAWLPARAFEATARTVEGEHRVYARYVGENGGAS